MSNIAFRPVRGKESSILAMDISEGCAYFAEDTGKIFIDTATERIPMGGSGAAIYYGRATDVVENETTSYYDYPITGLEDKQASPKVGDIILNSDGKFFRILYIQNTYFECILLAVSGSGDGSGGGGTTGKTRPTLMLEPLFTYNLINGQDAKVYFTATSAVVGDTVLSQDITIAWSLSYKNAAGAEEIYHQEQKTVKHGIRDFIDFGVWLKDSAITKVTLQASALNHEAESWIQSISVSTSNLELSHISSFSPTNIYNANNVILSCNAIGNTAKILDFYFDGELLEHRVLAANALTTQSYTVPNHYCTHGHHSVAIELYQSLDGNYGLGVEPLKFEIPVVIAGNDKPIIWLGGYQSVYYNYDSIQIPFLVYNPSDTTKAVIHLYKNRIEIGTRDITSFSGFSYWEIADADLDQLNYYQISCGEDKNNRAEREIIFTVEKDPNRDMTIVKQESLQLNFDPLGRSNEESEASRATWKQGDISAVFNNFNWENNGWKMDEEISQTCLRISNGASLTIPFGELAFGQSVSHKQSATIEIQCKIKNVQKYNNLITNVTRYNFKDGDTILGTDEECYKDFLAQDVYDNYDAYLQATLTPEKYEQLDYSKVQKNINLSNVAIGFYDNNGENNVVGVCVGPQDTFFSNGTNTVNVSFVENEMVNLSYVYDHSLKLLFIYINGCITGVIKSSISDFIISSGNIVFNSSACDIDLYKFRIYNTNLNVNDIVINYAVDRKDIDVYDQNGLAKENQALKEYQLQFEAKDNGIEKYIQEHPNKPMMPYIIYDTTDFTDNRLPWSKQITRNIKVEFVNTPLDRAYASGELEELARKDGLISESETDPDKIREAVRLYYKHHCPSWTSTLKTADRVEIVVQGTSSEFYPRRNFKIKTKIKDVEVWDDEEENDDGTVGAFIEDDVLNIFMNKGPYAEAYTEDAKKVLEDNKYYGHEESRLADGWYMNNYTNPTDRWTMKVDYMESSGSYNAGYASLIGNAYTKHPLQDYLNVLSDPDDKLKSPISALSSKIRWEDYRTSLLGFPVMAFQKRLAADGKTPEYIFIGYYRMLLDKGSDQVLGFKPNKKVTSTLFKTHEGKPKAMRDVAECWEFANNSRTFCSFRDPWNRVQLQFKAPVGVDNEFTADLAPIVMNNFEFRYHWAEDYLDELIAYKTLNQDKLNKLISDLRKDTGDNTIPDLVACGADTPENKESNKAKARLAQDITLSFHKNWEDVCAWVWSTNMDSVPAQGTYSEKPVPVGKVVYTPNQYFILDEATSTYIIDTSNSYTPGRIYYNEKEDEKLGTIYVNAYVAEEKYVYKPYTFYQKVAGAYSLVGDEAFNDTIDYYEFTSYSDTELAQKADLLIAPADISVGFNSNTQYYLFNKDALIRVKRTATDAAAVTAVTNATEEEFLSGIYYVAAPVTYSGKEYKYDTQEYRSAKFINELTSHFDPEYLAAYFIATEVFECYDSRGKNCMMASWGPQVAGGNYIWYPIFYDIDTQLGINNTGIPSFEFNVDVTDANNFSTSDSILWNNFYKFFKSSYILTKYQNMRGIDNNTWKDLPNAPLQSVDYLEKWYTFDPETTKNIACRGERPLIATNLDMYFKYITITNDAAIAQGVGYLQGNDGIMSQDKDGMYFYALQGDRSQSRRQFLTNRIEYIDSWLNQGNYARAGNNRIRGRISANNVGGDTHSDIWIEPKDGAYWADKEFGTKTHEFDSQYWIDLKPIRSSYVTAGDDSANYPSQKYDGVNTAKFKLAELEQGIRESANYPEQLLYIYGMNQMQDVGDMSKMYWTEFYLEGSAPKLTRLKLGHDALSTTDGGKWYNKKLNGITLVPLPLLKEANFCNIGLSNETTLDLTASEKLENFRATGTSKLVTVKFAKGVALNTLYLPESVTELSLSKANLLTDLIVDNNSITPALAEHQAYYTTPTTIDAATGELSATPGLYLEGFFGETFSSGISSINLDGGALGYNSYTLLDRFYKAKLNSSNTKIVMTDVKWCPFVPMSEGESYDYDYAYYRNNGHYGLEWYDVNPDNYNSFEFNKLILNGELYKAGPYVLATSENAFNTRYIYFQKEKENTYKLIDLTSDTYNTAVANGNIYYINKGAVVINDSCYSMLSDLYTKTDKFIGATAAARPTISGIIYIENETPIKESDIRNTLQNQYPNVTFFFKNVIKAYSARFIIEDEKTGVYKYVRFKDGTTSIPSVQKIDAEDLTFVNGVSTGKFVSPFELYDPEKTHYDFQGWSTVPNPGASDILITKPAEGKDDMWNTQNIGFINEGEYDYTFYAIFTIHEYELKFYSHDGLTELETVRVPYGAKAVPPTLIPYRDDSSLDLYESYDFQGWSLAVNGSLIDVTSITVSGDEEFYASFKLIEDIRTVVHDEYFIFSDELITVNLTGYGNGDDYSVTGYGIIGPKVSLQGKVVIPKSHNNYPVVALGGFAPSKEAPQYITHIFMEKASEEDRFKPIAQIYSNAFDTLSTLKYFEFESTDVRIIEQYAFRKCSLNADNLKMQNTNIIYFGQYAFNQGIFSTSKANINLPSSLYQADYNAFTNLDCSAGIDLTIGSQENPSVLNLAAGNGPEKTFTQKNGINYVVNFYSALYDDSLDNIGPDSSMTVLECFGSSVTDINVV